MDNKLFEVEPQSRKVIFELHTYKGNRLVSKMMKTLKENGTFQVRNVTDSYLDENTIFEITQETTKEGWIVRGELKEEIELMIPELFPENYQFTFNFHKLGFTETLKVYSNETDGVNFFICHKIKEVRRDGRTNIPRKQILFEHKDN